MLIHKGAGRPVDGANYFRPICLINCVAKLYERMLLARLNLAVDEGVGISDRQFGFRAGSGTTHAIRRVLEDAKLVTSGVSREGRQWLLFTLDVKNAFNTAPMGAIDGALRRKRIPKYLLSGRSWREGS